MSIRMSIRMLEELVRINEDVSLKEEHLSTFMFFIF